MMDENNNALILFSRLPIGHETKTRLSPLLTETQRQELHLAMWSDIFGELVKLRADIYFYWTGSGSINDFSQYIPSKFHLFKQTGSTLGERMTNAMNDIFTLKYERAVLIGSDVPELGHEDIERAFDELKSNDIVLGPSLDGGYWLIGMRKFTPEAFNISSWGNASVLDGTLRQIRALGLSYSVVSEMIDIDTPEDVKEFLSENYQHGNITRMYLRNLMKG